MWPARNVRMNSHWEDKLVVLAIEVVKMILYVVLFLALCF